MAEALGALFACVLIVICLAFIAGVLWLIWGVLAWVAKCSRYTFSVCAMALEQACQRMIDN